MDNEIVNMKYIIDNYYKLNRTSISKDQNKLVKYISEYIGSDIKKIKSGTKCLTWEIPKSWEVVKGYIKDLDGNIIVDFKNNPLHLWACSVSFEGEISFEELKKHLLYCENQKDKIPHHGRNQYTYKKKEWGFCLTYNDYIKMKDKKYYVSIETKLDKDGTMDIIEHNVEGKSKETFLLGAHTCHPAMVTDGLSNVAVLLELIKRLEKRKLNKSYKFIFGPEFYAAAGYLENETEENIKNIKYTCYFDMLGNNEDICYQTSFFGDTYIDDVLRNVMKYNLKTTKEYGYRKLWGNDETFYNGPGYLIPSVGIGGDKFINYHYDSDDNTFVNYDQLKQSIDIIEKIIDVLENDYTPKLKYKGPLYLSKYGLYYDAKKYPKIYEAIESMQILANGQRGVLEIANIVNMDFDFVYNIFKTIDSIELK